MTTTSKIPPAVPPHLSPLNKAGTLISGKTPQPGAQERVQRPAGKIAAVVAAVKSAVGPKAVPAAAVPAQAPAVLSAAAIVAAQPDAPTHVSVPVATLQAMHATLSAHADAILALLPATTPEARAAANALATASRLKQQEAAGK